MGIIIYYHKATRIQWKSHHFGMNCFHIVNCPRICVSPDYVLVHEEAEQQLIEALKAAVARMTPEKPATELGKATGLDNGDNGSVQSFISV